jgi:hypothetical protein
MKKPNGRGYLRRFYHGRSLPRGNPSVRPELRQTGQTEFRVILHDSDGTKHIFDLDARQVEILHEQVLTAASAAGISGVHDRQAGLSISQYIGMGDG